MQARRQRRTWPPITLDELSQLNQAQLETLAKERNIRARVKRVDLIMSLYWHIHELDKRPIKL